MSVRHALAYGAAPLEESLHVEHAEPHCRGVEPVEVLRRLGERLRNWLAVSQRLPGCFARSESAKAIAPVTCGAAMLVPLMATVPLIVPAFAAHNSVPGADNSGFLRRSLVRPHEERGWTTKGSCELTAATVITDSAVPGTLSVVSLV